MYMGFHVKYLFFGLILTRIIRYWNSNNCMYKNLMKIHMLGVRFFHAGGWTEMTRLVVAICCVNVPKPVWEMVQDA
jgi:hypothetical protein